MRLHIVFSMCVALAICGCGPSAPKPRTYTLQGQVLSIDPNRQQATIKHEEIKGFMSAMTMPYKLQDPKLADGLQPGDLINATLVVVSNDAYLSEVRKVGTAPLEKAAAEGQAASDVRPASLRPGEQVPNASFVDQDGRKRDVASFKGSTLVLTFIYTRCPMPNFCPLMDRQFAEIQRAIKDDASLKKVHLVSVSFDPETDTPPVLKRHAEELKADPARWTFLTGQLADIDQFSARFGVSVSRTATDANFTHNLRTAIVDAKGTLVKAYTGNEWTPQQAIADLAAVAAAN
jgi:protein SCO1/2